VTRWWRSWEALTFLVVYGLATLAICVIGWMG
jgi:hypothetical protein